MARLDYGAPGKGGPAKGSWGDRYIIEKKPYRSKRVSCSKCSHYCGSDRSCLVSPVYPPIDGYDYWKRCNKFELAERYNWGLYREQVIKVKGLEFFYPKKEHEKPQQNLAPTSVSKKKKRKKNGKVSRNPETLLKYYNEHSLDFYLLTLGLNIDFPRITCECELELQENESSYNHLTDEQISDVYWNLFFQKIGYPKSRFENLGANRARFKENIIKIITETNEFDWEEVMFGNAKTKEKFHGIACTHWELFSHANKDDMSSPLTTVEFYIFDKEEKGRKFYEVGAKFDDWYSYRARLKRQYTNFRNVETLFVEKKSAIADFYCCAEDVVCDEECEFLIPGWGWVSR